MKTLLYVAASIFSQDGESSRLARLFVEGWRQRNPLGRVIERDLARDPVPHLDAETFRAFATAPEQRTDAQRARVALSDRLIAELQAADVVVLGVPMYNFQIPSTLKAYFDHVARAGITFRYTPDGSEGLLKGKKAYVFSTCGGVYPGAGDETQTRYLRYFLGFLGIEDVTVVRAEGLALGEESKRAALARAAAAVRSLDAQPQLAA